MLLVTGITGHTGHYFLKELIKKNYSGKIRCFTRRTSSTDLLIQSGLDIEVFQGDLDKQHDISKAMNGIITVVHIYNINHSINVVKTAIENGVKRVILVHTTGIYSKFKAASSEYKRIEEQICALHASSSLKMTILRPTMIYGDICDRNISKFIKLIDSSRLIPLINHGENLVQPVNARDLGSALFAVLMQPEKTTNKSYIISGDRPLKLKELFQLISNELRKKTRYISFSLYFCVFNAKMLNIITDGKFNYVEKVMRMGEDRAYTHSDASNDFGFSPMRIEEGIKMEVQQYLASSRKNVHPHEE